MKILEIPLGCLSAVTGIHARWGMPHAAQVTNQSQWTAPLSDAGQGTVEAEDHS